MQTSLTTSNYELKNLSKINIILGKNGCGKSTILREIAGCSLDKTLIKYITPQRGGELSFESGIEQTMLNNIGWLDQTRKNNHSTNFKQQTIAQYKNLVFNIYQEFHDNTLGGKDAIAFAHYLNMINELLDEIIIIKPDKSNAFKILKKSADVSLTAAQISSGESELICLAIECLSVISKLDDKNGILLLDEPDVHLHPDLQDRLIKFLLNLLEQKEQLQIIIATHSTAILGALSNNHDASIAFILPGSYHMANSEDKKEIKFNKIIKEYNKILPIFGAHPLTQVYCEMPLLLVEGEDDVRIWQQVVRSSENKIKLSPVECGTVDKINEFEKIANNVLSAIYNSTAKVYSVRDGDGKNEELDDDKQITQITRFRLKCY